ncbi:MAG TPA: non-heme iron oxygenase ferredoxin subunit [Thermodesulfobacteriota bacterium]|jgi:nitrite reductase/ring-hydroxylating ferredoxin subunit|nr:non-heme iron oxygenase ferredoxin subunit [Thermodesulfobacteriota bacterium]
MAEFVKVAKTSDIPPGEVRSFVVDGEVIAICHVDGRFYAIKDECTHMEYPLSDGVLEGEVITCAYHGAEFNVRTGEALSLPAIEPVETFKLKLEGDDIYVLLEY